MSYLKLAWRWLMESPYPSNWVPEPHHSTQRGVYINYALLARLQQMWNEE